MARIAIVDDSRLVRVFAAGALRAAGHEAIEILPTSIPEVIARLREITLDLLLVDFLMPDCPGESLIQACREDVALKALPILVVSAHRDDLSLVHMQQLGISGFLLKPVEASALVAKVAEVLEG